jgi:hypothetical protein
MLRTEVYFGPPMLRGFDKLPEFSSFLFSHYGTHFEALETTSIQMVSLTF